MECQEFRKSIPEFASMSLKYDQMARCLEHVEGCASCRDEPEIYFILERGIKDNEAFDGPFVLKNIVNECFDKARQTINRGRRMKRLKELLKIFIYIILFAAVVVLVTYLL